MAFENVKIHSLRNGISPVDGYREDLAVSDVVSLSLTDLTGVTGVKWLLVGRPEGSVAGGAGPEPITLAIATTASFTVDTDAGFHKDGTYTVHAIINPGTPSETTLSTILVRTTGILVTGGRTLRKIGGFEALEDTSNPSIAQGYATMINRWLEEMRQIIVGGGIIETLAGAYSAGASAGDQTLNLDDGKGGGIIIDATGGGFTGQSALQVHTAANSPVTVDRATGNVGLGVLAPLQAVHVKRAAPTLRLEDTGGGGIVVDAKNTAGALELLVGATVLALFPGTGGVRTDFGLGIGLAPTTSKTIAATGGANAAPLSSAGTGRLQYNVDVNHWQFSENGGAWTNFGSGTGGAPATATFVTTHDETGTLTNSFHLSGHGAGFVTTDNTGAITIDTNTYLTTAAAATYLTIATAASTYETQTHASSTYLTIAGAAATYLTITSAASTYQVKLTSASGANLTSHFIVQGTADSGLPNAQFLGALPTGILKNTTTTGVLSVAAANTDFASPNAFYVVTQAGSEPPNAVDLGLLTSGVLQQTVSGAASTLAALDMVQGQVPFGASNGTLTQDPALSFSFTDSGNRASLLLSGIEGGTLRLNASTTPGVLSNSIIFQSAGATFGSFQGFAGSSGSHNYLRATLTPLAGGDGQDFVDVVSASFGNTLWGVSATQTDMWAGSPTQVLATSTTGFVWFPTIAGPPTGVPALVSTHSVARNPLIIDNGDKRLYWRDQTNNVWHYVTFDDGLSTSISNTHVLVNQAEATLPNSINLGVLGNGVLQQTTSGSVATVTPLNMTAKQVPYGAASNGVLTQNAGLTFDDSVYQLHILNPNAGLGQRHIKLEGAVSPFGVGIDFFGGGARYAAIIANTSTAGPASFGIAVTASAAPSSDIFSVTAAVAGPESIQSYINDMDVYVGARGITAGGTTGFLWQPPTTGVPGTPAHSGNGRTATTIDTTDFRQYAYLSGAWHFSEFTDYDPGTNVGRIPFVGATVHTLTDSANLTWDNTNDALTVTSANVTTFPHSSLKLNHPNATASNSRYSAIAFQRNGTDVAYVYGGGNTTSTAFITVTFANNVASNAFAAQAFSGDYSLYTETQTGDVAVGLGPAMLVGATGGFLHLPKIAGTPTGIPALAGVIGGARVPVTVDLSNAVGRLWEYNGTGWHYASFDDGASYGAHALVTQADATFPNTTNLGALGTGLLYQTVTGSVSTPAALSVGANQVVYGKDDSSGVPVSSANFLYEDSNERVTLFGGTPRSYLRSTVNGAAIAIWGAYWNTNTEMGQMTFGHNSGTQNFIQAEVSVAGSGDYFAAKGAPNGGGAANPPLIAFTQTNDVMVGRDVKMLAAATNGFVYLPTITAAPSGVPAYDGISPAGGRKAVALDDTNIRLYSYMAGAWHYVVFDNGNGASAITALTGDGTATGPGSAAFTLANSGVTAGAYTNANITVDAKGRVTLASNGSGGGSGITQLTGDVTAGPGSGSQAATIAKLSAFTTNGFVKTSGGTGTITIDTTVYLPTFSLASGSVMFSGGGSTVSQDTNNFFYDSANHRLVLGKAGTFTPAAGPPLTVSSNGGSLDSWGTAITLDGAGDQGLTKATSGNLVIANKVAASGISFVTASSSQAFVDNTGTWSIKTAIPVTDNTYNLGSSSQTWKAAWINTLNVDVTIQSTGSSLTIQDTSAADTQIVLNGSQIQVKGTVVPTAGSTYNFGSNTASWAFGYFDSVVGVSSGLQLQDTDAASSNCLIALTNGGLTLRGRAVDVIFQGGTTTVFRVDHTTALIRFVNGVEAATGLSVSGDLGPASQGNHLVLNKWVHVEDNSGVDGWIPVYQAS